MQVLAEENQRDIVEFCKKEGLVLLADEVNNSYKLAKALFIKTFMYLICYGHYAGIPRKYLCPGEAVSLFQKSSPFNGIR